MPFPNQTRLGSGGRWPAWEGGQFVVVHMGVDEAALHLHHIVVSLLCILLVIEEEEVSCLVGVKLSRTMMARMVKVQDMSSC